MPAKDIKTVKDLSKFSQMLTKITVEAALNAELDEHLGYDKHQPSVTDNSCNGYSQKILKAEEGRFEVNIPRDRDSSFEPQIVKKHQTRLTAMDDKIHCLYAKGMTTREIVEAIKDMYGADVSASLISKVADAVIEQVVEWQSRPLDAVYPIVYLDCIVVKIRHLWVRAPTRVELTQLAHTIARQVGRYLEWQGLLERDVENDYLALDAAHDDPLSVMQGHSITYHIAVGPQAGHRWVRRPGLARKCR